MIAVNNFNQEKVDRVRSQEENKILKMTIDERDKEVEDLNKLVDDCKYVQLLFIICYKF